MSNQAPWSVKGIDPRAREAAREAARRQGLTIGEWLNQAILANEAALANVGRDDGERAPYRETRARETRTNEPRALDTRDQRVTEALHQLAERVDVNDRRSALAMLGMDRTLSVVAARVEQAEARTQDETGRVADLLDELRDAQAVLLEKMRQIETDEAQGERIEAIEGDLYALSARALEAEQATGAALARLDTAMTALDAKLSEAVSPGDLDVQASAMRDRFDASLDTMAQDVASMIAETRADIAGQIVSALGGLQPEEMNAALADMSRRLTAAEKRHTQTIEAVSIEIKRLSESMDRRLRTVEARNDDGSGAELREEVAAMSRTLEQRLGEMSKTTEHRLGEMEAREAAAFSRMGEEVGRIAERLDVRVSGSEARSAEAIDKVGEQVALMAERLSAKQDKFATEVAERIVQSEERQGGRLSQALAAISTRLSAIETQTSETISPVAAAMDTFAARLAAIEAHAGAPVTLPDIEPISAPAYLDAPVVHAEPPPPELRAPVSARFALEHEADLHARYTPPPEPVHAPLHASLDEPIHQPIREPVHEPVHAPLHEPHRAPYAEAPLERSRTGEPEQIVEANEKETVFLEDIEEEFARREEDPAFAPRFELPQGAPNQARNVDDPFADIEAAPPEEEEEDLFWSTGKVEERVVIAPIEAPPRAEDEDEALASFAPDRFTRRHDELDEFDARDDIAPGGEKRAQSDEAELERSMFGADLDLEPSPAPKEDYLSAARRAAQANAAPLKKTSKRDKSADAVEQSPGGLRGMTRVVLWGAAGVAAAAVAGGIYVYANQKPQKGDFQPPPHKSASLAPPGSIAEGAALAAAQDGDALSDEAVPLDYSGIAPARAGPIDLPELVPDSAPASAGPGAQPISARVVIPTLEDAAARGDAVAQYEIALSRLSAGDTPRAVAYLRRAAGQGLAMAQYRLAKLHERGEGVPLDLNEARRWTERAAVAGNRKAMHDLGVYYARGEGAPFDEGQAYKWFRQAAEYGVADSQFNLGVLYSQGRGVAANPSEALFWFSIAAQGGDVDARARAAMIEQKMDPKTLTGVMARVQAYRPKPTIARANGDFGARAWAPAPSLEASASAVPRT